MSQSIIDRAIIALSPSWGLRRIRARAALGVFGAIGTGGSYDGGTLGPRWPRISRNTSANAVLSGADILRLRDRARHLTRNNPFLARALDIWQANVVGLGIVPASRTGNKAKDKKVNDLWKAWSSQCDAAGRLDFNGLTALAVRSAFEGGDVLVRMRPRRAEDGLVVPMQLQLIEGDQLDSSRNGLVPGTSGRQILGIEIDGIGRRTQYWLFPEHPGDLGQFAANGLISQPVPAADVCHLYRMLRVGQMRGVSAFAPVLLPANDLAQMWDAIVVKARIEACYAGFITSDETDSAGLAGKKVDGMPTNITEMNPGMLARLKPGESVTFSSPASATNYDPLLVQALLPIAVGCGLTYDQLTGDLRQANYSSLRAGKVEQRRLIEQTQYHMLIPQFCEPIRRRWLELAILSGALRGKPEDYPCEWIAPAHEAIDPLKDMQADVMAVRSGRMTLGQFIAAWGNDPQSHLEAIAESNKVLDELGLVLDTDPRKVNQKGLAQGDQTVVQGDQGQNDGTGQGAGQ